MSFIDVDDIKAFVKDNSWLTADEMDAGTTKLVAQIDSLIYNKTKVEIPSSAATAPGVLKNVACALLVYFSSGKAGELTQDERLRRAKLYDDAIQYLNDVEAGKTEVIGDDGVAISTSKSFVASFTSTQIVTAVDRP